MKFCAEKGDNLGEEGEVVKMGHAPLLLTSLKRYGARGGNGDTIKIPPITVTSRVMVCRVKGGTSTAGAADEKVYFTAPDAQTLRAVLFVLFSNFYRPDHVKEKRGADIFRTDFDRFLIAIEAQQQGTVDLSGICGWNMGIRWGGGLEIMFATGGQLPDGLELLSKVWVRAGIYPGTQLRTGDAESTLNAFYLRVQSAF